MTMMSHREDNMVRWLGVRPAHRGEQVVKSGIADNSTVVIHTVTVGKVLFLCGASLCLYSTASGLGNLFITDSVDAVQYTLFILEYVVNQPSPNGSISFPFPLEIPAEYKIKTWSGTADCLTNGFIHGWEEDA